MAQTCQFHWCEYVKSIARFSTKKIILSLRGSERILQTGLPKCCCVRRLQASSRAGLLLSHRRQSLTEMPRSAAELP
jgi:hypothetical protein